MEKITAYKTENGTLFETEEQAMAYDQRCKVYKDLLGMIQTEFGIDQIEGVDFANTIFNIFEKHGYVANLSARGGQKEEEVHELFLRDTNVLSSYVACKCGQPVQWKEWGLANGMIYRSYCEDCEAKGHTSYTWKQIINLPNILPKWSKGE